MTCYPHAPIIPAHAGTQLRGGLAANANLLYVPFMFYVYIVTNKRNGTLYTGHTDDIVRRAEEHRLQVFQGFAQKHRCIYLVWYEEHATRSAAFLRERRIKKWERKWKLDMIEDQNPLWLDLGEVPMWPLPDRALYPEIWNQALKLMVPR